MSRPASRLVAFTLAIVLAAAPLPGRAVAPALLLFIRQMAQQAVTSMIKDTLLSGLSGLGCKGMALSNALAAFDRRSIAGGLPMMPGAGGLPTMADVPPEMLARMNTLMPGGGQLPPGLGLDAEQQAALARMQQAMSQPLPVPETLATIDELFELGFLPPAVQTEFKQCLLLVPAAIPALGMGMGMLKPMIPQLRGARDELRALPPAEQDEVAAALAQELKALPAAQREAMLEHLDSGFFPARVSQGVKARLAGR